MNKDNKYPGLLVAPYAGQGSLQAENSNSSPLIEMIVNTLELCRSLQAENDFLRQELQKQHFIRAVLEHKHKPKKRGPKPKSKSEIDNAPKKRGKPPIFPEETLNLMIEYVDTLKESEDFKTNKEVLIDLLLKRGWPSKWRAEQDVNKFETLLSKARRKRRQAETEQQPND